MVAVLLQINLFPPPPQKKPERALLEKMLLYGERRMMFFFLKTIRKKDLPQISIEIEWQYSLLTWNIL